LRRQIYLDCDGVLADFDSSARTILGAPSEVFERRHGAGEFWKRLARADGFFANLDPLPDAFELYDAVKAKAPIILTPRPAPQALGRRRRPVHPPHIRQGLDRGAEGRGVYLTLRLLPRPQNHA
jgi:hypothetical protein